MGALKPNFLLKNQFFYWKWVKKPKNQKTIFLDTSFVWWSCFERSQAPVKGTEKNISQIDSEALEMFPDN